jgi:hypothetical protein
MNNRLNWVAVALVLTVGILHLHYPLLMSHYELHGDLGDGRLVMLLLEHSYQYLTSSADKGFWAAEWNFHPFPNSFAMSEPMTGNILLYGPLRWIGMSVEDSTRIWTILTSVANFVSWLAALKLLGLSTLAAGAGSYLFSFAMIRASFMNHLHLLPTYPASLAIVCSLLAWNTPQTRKRLILAGLAGLCLSWQFWSSLHIGWFCIFGCSIFALSGLISSWRQELLLAVRKRWSLLAMIAAVFGLSVFPLYFRLHSLHQMVGREREFHVVQMYMLKANSYFLPSPDSWLYGWLYDLVAPHTGLTGEKTSFAGLLPLVIAIAAISTIFKSGITAGSKLSRHTSKLWILTAISFWIIFLIATRDILGLQIWPIVYDYLPGAASIRAIGRISILQLGLLSIMTALFVDRLMSSRYRRWTTVFIALLLAENFAPATYSFDPNTHRARIEKIQAEVLQKCAPRPKTIFAFNGLTSIDSAVDVMWYSQQSHISTANGYSGFTPPNYMLSTQRGIEQIIEWHQLNGMKIEAEEICLIEGIAPEIMSGFIRNK